MGELAHGLKQNRNIFPYTLHSMPGGQRNSRSRRHQTSWKTASLNSQPQWWHTIISRLGFAVFSLHYSRPQQLFTQESGQEQRSGRHTQGWTQFRRSEVEVAARGVAKSTEEGDTRKTRLGSLAVRGVVPAHPITVIVIVGKGEVIVGAEVGGRVSHEIFLTLHLLCHTHHLMKTR